MSSPTVNMSKDVHGEKGLYCGGGFVPIEECAALYENPSGAKFRQRTASSSSSSSSSSTSSSSSSSSSSLTDAQVFDVVIVGGGCVGGAVARELSKYNCSTLLVEAADDVTQGATKGNSGIVHAGFDDEPGTNRAKHCRPGNEMFEQLDRELHFGYVKNGSLVVARGADEEKILDELLERGHVNGVKRLRIVRGAELFELEPNLDRACTAALLASDCGSVTPYEFTIALVENAVDNGVKLMLNTQGKRRRSSFFGTEHFVNLI